MKNIGSVRDALTIRIKAFWFGIKKNNGVVLDVLIIGVGTFLLGTAKPALVILGIVGIFLFSTCYVPRLGEWFVGAGSAVCVAIAALFILNGTPILNAFSVGTFLGSVVLITMGNMLVRRQRLEYWSFAGQMAELPEVTGDAKEVKK